MLKNSLLNKLFIFGMHIGDFLHYNSMLNYYVLGKRFNFYIIDLNKTFLLLKKALLFINKLALYNGSLLFYYSNYYNVELLYKCFFISLTKKTNQQLVTYDWINGSISNYFFSFHSLLQDITKSWYLHNKFLFNNDTQTNRFNNYNYDDSKYSFLDFAVFNFKQFYSNCLNHNRFRSWYGRWIKLQHSYDLWQSKKKALKYTNFIKQLCLNDLNNLLKKKSMLHFKYLFLKLFYYINMKKKDPFFLDVDSDVENIYFFKYDFIHKKFLSFWRFILYFKYFNNMFQLPDALFSIFPDNNDLALKDVSSANLVSIGVVDTSCSMTNITYPIISNDDSLVIVFFYFTLFSNVFLENKHSVYNSILK